MKKFLLIVLLLILGIRAIFTFIGAEGKEDYGKKVVGLTGISYINIGDTHSEIKQKLDSVGFFSDYGSSRLESYENAKREYEDIPELTYFFLDGRDANLGVSDIYNLRLNFCQDTLYQIDISTSCNKKDFINKYIEKYGRGGTDEKMLWIDPESEVCVSYKVFSAFDGNSLREMAPLSIGTTNDRIIKKVASFRDKHKQNIQDKSKAELNNL